MAYDIAEFFAKLSFKIDSTAVDQFERGLRNLENRIMQLDKRLTGKFDKIQKGFAKQQMMRKRDLEIQMKETNLATAKIKQGMTALALSEKQIKAGQRKNKTDQQGWGVNLRGIQSSIALNKQRHREEIQLIRQRSRELRRQTQDALRTGNASPIGGRNKSIRNNMFMAEEAAYRMNNAFDRSNRPRTASGTRRSAFLGAGAGSSAMSFGRAFLPGLGGAWALSGASRINQQMQGQELALQSVLGTPEKAKASKDWMEKYSNYLGIDYRESLPSYTKMLASGMSSGMNEGQVRGIFSGVSEYGKVLGLDKEAQKGSLRAIEQMLNKQQVMA